MRRQQRVFAVVVVALFFTGAYLMFRASNERQMESAARAAFALDCRSSVTSAFIQGGQEVDAVLMQAACNSGNFDAHKEAIVACYRDVGAAQFTECVADKGIRNPP